MEFMGTLAGNRAKTFDQLEPNFRNTLERYGLGESSWNNIRSTELYNFRGCYVSTPGRYTRQDRSSARPSRGTNDPVVGND